MHRSNFSDNKMLFIKLINYWNLKRIIELELKVHIIKVIII